MDPMRTCPICSQVTEVPAHVEGTSFPCANCGHPLPVAATTIAEPAKDQGTPSSHDKVCLACKGSVPEGAVNCPHCGEWISDFSDGLLQDGHADHPPEAPASPSTEVWGVPPADISAVPPRETPTAAEGLSGTEIYVPPPPPPPSPPAHEPEPALGLPPMAEFLPAPEAPPAPNVEVFAAPPAPNVEVFAAPPYAPEVFTAPASTGVFTPRASSLASPEIFTAPITPAGAETPPPPATAPTSLPPQRPTQNLLIILGVLLVIALIAIPLAFWLGRNKGPANPLLAQGTTTTTPIPPVVGTPAPVVQGTTTVEPVVQPTPRPFKPRTVLVNAVLEDLKRFPPDEQKFQRYFSLVHLHNNPSVALKDLEDCKLALLKLLEQLGGQSVTLEPADKDQLVYRLDLLQLGWEQKDGWEEILKYYPYGLLLKESKVKNKELVDAARQILKKTDTEIPWINADWFVATASKAPLATFLAVKPGGLAELPEIVKIVSSRYQQPVSLETAVSELGVPDSKAVQEMFDDKADKKRAERLRDLGLEPLASGTAIPRETWTALSANQPSPFQVLARELSLGIPYQFR